ncbi:ribosome maturation factor RimM [Parasedimentitalea huanghaiensis]|uniref:Ribosome maturation factor RimM n=1 Tax=Parasedimentitalea huanghaiensis TaxID=2682100 RepID=A0A6L6WL71_9RHOB|nr:ribosome maturation factor RimM [Zongyanglinia huanghaiensis]MVO17739.1 16S rRNA processing protein RimM [Zongyanglinia huanghaiensis]
MTDLICIGAVAGSFGVRGEVRLKSFCAVPEDIESYSPLKSEDGSQSFSVSLTRVTNNGFVAILGGIDTKEQADAIKGLRLFAPRDALPLLPDDEYYYTDLTGLEVFDTGGTRLGQVKSVENHGAGDLLEIHGPGLKDTVLLPFTLAAVPTVDLEQGRIIADPPDGLF